MPYQIRKIKNQNLYSVKNKETGEVHSYGTTKENAIKQVRLLHMNAKGFEEEPKKKKRRKKKKEKEVIIHFQGILIGLIMEIFGKEEIFWNYLDKNLDQTNKEKMFKDAIPAKNSIGNLIKDGKLNSWGDGYNKTIEIIIKAAHDIYKKNPKIITSFIEKNKNDINEHYIELIQTLLLLFSDLPKEFICDVKENTINIFKKSPK